jgi:hypothetical protein
MRKFTLITGLLLMMSIVSQSLVAQHAQMEKFKYLSPKPGSKFINPENNIAFRHGDVLKATSVKNAFISVTGSLSGEISGEVILSKDAKTLIFYPAKPYKYGESIKVSIESGIKTETGITLEGTSFTFYVAGQDNKDLIEDFYRRESEKEKMNGFHSSTTETSSQVYKKSTTDYPEGLPLPTITEFDNPTPGYIFVTPRPWQTAPYDPYMMILDNYGTPVFYRQRIRRANDFKPVVNNQLVYCDFDNNNVEINKYLLMDSWFNIIDTLLMGNGYIIDQHDILMRENGNHFLMAYDPQLVGMDTVVPGGNPQATVVGFVIQELDADHNVIFQWRSWDHFEITDANHKDFTGDHIDYVHGNAFELDYNNTLMMSCRDMEEITKIDLNTGEIIWRLGLHAQNNMFDFLNDTIGFSWQHDIRRLENGNITVYDNGNWHTPKFSQALEYQIDEQNFTAELVWNYIHDPVVYGRATGSHRRLANNNALICWGLIYTGPVNYSEVTHDNSLAWELNWPDGVWEYRAFKFDWQTDLFVPNKDTIDFGEYDDYVFWPSIIILSNNSDEDIEITSTHNHNTSYNVSTSLPLTIPANGTAELTVNFFPTQHGQIDDVLTIKSESMYSDTLHQMIARQVFLTGYVEDNVAPDGVVYPVDGMIEIPQDEVLSISFNESVVKADGSTLKTDQLSEILKLKETDASGENVEYSAFIDAWKKTITITPDTLKPSQTYYLELPAGAVADNSGNVLSEAISSTFTTDEEQGIIELTRENFAKIYPNPNSGTVNLEFQNTEPKEIQVFDMKGNIVYSEDYNQLSVTELNLQNIPDGVYVVKVTNLINKKMIQLKMLKK